VRDFVGDLTSHFGATVIDKRTASEMQVAARVVRFLGVDRSGDFLHYCASTIGRRIYLPFEVGTPADGFDLWGQIVAATHACQRVVQYDALGGLRLAIAYLGSAERRVRLDAEAYRTTLELLFWRTGHVATARTVALAIRSFGATEEDVDLADATIDRYGDRVEQGAVATHAGRFAVDWLDEHAPELGAAKVT
jgi:hypothetical protein